MSPAAAPPATADAELAKGRTAADAVPNHAEAVPSHADAVPNHADAGPTHADAGPANGLTAAEAAKRLVEHGRNELKGKPRPSGLRIFLGQFRGTMNVLLLVAGILSVAVGDAGDAVAILAIALLNAGVGAFQEARAERAMDALGAMTAPRARVQRDGQVHEIAAAEVVPGDLLLLQAGDVLAADGELMGAARLQVSEAVLTGESMPVTKAVGPTAPNTPLAERTGQVFTGTVIAGGTGRARVTATGRATELGRIAGMLEESKPAPIPLKVQLEKVARTLVVVCLVAVVAVGLLGWARGMPWTEVLLTAISLAVAAVPEGLLAIVTVALAIGLERLSRRNVLVRRLPAVETLGCTTVICTDKTGTLTTGNMAVREVWPPRSAPQGSAATEPAPRPSLPGSQAPDSYAAAGLPSDPLSLAALACDPSLAASTGPLVGDPTEVAVILALSAQPANNHDGTPAPKEAPATPALKQAGEKAREQAGTPAPKQAPIQAPTQAPTQGRAQTGTLSRLEDAFPRLATAPFDTERRRMGVLRQVGDERVLLVKGAPETVMALCPERPADVERALDGMAERGLRVLAVALKRSPRDELDDQVLQFVGLVGMADPPRPEAAAAIKAARAAGVRTVMITGDHLKTATAIAREIGLLTDNDDPEQVIRARATPEDKLRLVRELVAEGEVVAMTGDGVNDAPALQEAHVGIAMGQAGTEVTRRAASIVLADDNFASIVAGIEEGRGVYENIQTTIVYLLGGNVGELALMLIVGAVGAPMPLLPIQLLWINLVTDGLPGLMLVMNPPSKDVLLAPPRAPGTPILNGTAWRQIAVIATLETATTTLTYLLALPRLGEDGARGLAFMTLIFSQLLRAFVPAGVEVGLQRPTTRLTLVVLASAALQLFLPWVPWLGGLVGVDTMTAPRVMLALAIGAAPTALLALSGLLRGWLRPQPGKALAH